MPLRRLALWNKQSLLKRMRSTDKRRVYGKRNIEDTPKQTGARKKGQKKQARMIEQDGEKVATGTFEDEKSKTARVRLAISANRQTKIFQ
jgi:hypothetical protein